MTTTPDTRMVSVPSPVLGAIAHNLCSLHDFDVTFVKQNERFARAVITEYLRAAAPAQSKAGEASHPTGNAIQDAVIAGFLHGVGREPWDDMQDYIAVCAVNYAKGYPLPLRSTPAREEGGGAVILKGVGKINGDGWKDTTTVGEVVFVWNAELPSPCSPGQYPRIGKEHWSASTSQYDFTPATVDEVRSLFAALTPREEALADHVADAGNMIRAQPQAREEAGAVACVIAFREGKREPELISWNKLPVGEHRLYAHPPAPDADKLRPSEGTHWWNPENDEEGFSCWGDAFEDATFMGWDAPVRLERAKKLPDVWAVRIDLDTDGDGEADDYEMHLFSTEAEALAALQQPAAPAEGARTDA